MNGPDSGVRDGRDGVAGGGAFTDGDAAAGPDPFENDDAAYLLGALGGARRAEFENHLSGCAACSARVTALGPLVGRIAAAGDAALAALRSGPVAVDTGRVAELAARVEARRRRHRWMFGGVAGIAAAAAAAFVVVLAVPSARVGPSTEPSNAISREMTPTGISTIRATAAIAAAPWGSEITINCNYVGTSQYVSGDVYTLEVVDRSGRSHQIGSWTLARSTTARFTSGTALAPAQIRDVTVATADGTVVLRLTE